MKTIKSLAEYTHSKKEHQISKENYFYTEPMCDINKFINGENSIAGIGLALDFLSSWYHYNYRQDFPLGIFHLLYPVHNLYNLLSLYHLYCILQI